MALAPKLEFRQSQQLVMTPQLQQAIKLLQLSNLELSAYVEEQLEQNPFLERAAESGDAAEPAEAARERDDQTTGDAETALDLSSDQTAAKAEEALDAEVEPSDAGGEFRVNEWASVGAGKGSVDIEREFGATLTKEISLGEHLAEQLHVATRDPQQRFIGGYLIDLIDEAGYLREPVSTVAERLGADEQQVESTLRLIQTFDPCGVGARDIKECLKLQLIERDRYDPAMARFIDNIELLAKGDLKGLMKATGSDEEDVRDMVAEVRSLTPKPGYAYGSEHVQVVEPDVFVRKAPDGGWKIELNNDTMPRILVNQRYYAEISNASSRDQDKVFLNEQFANANWLAKSLDQRARTILKVATEIVRQQDAFLVYGVKHLRPLNLRAVADAISMHESTVSRVTSNKYMATPRGLFELKYFFTAAIASSEGGEAHSAEAVRHRIRELVAQEDPENVLSDDKIVEILRADGVDIARRTVAKYRETLNIPSSVQRRRQALRTAI
ncbi:MAG: RNA polymerase factor sigma-54 [Alphaproteobacteria bacterium]|nr:RNA polymerase factor sigma-54 [Alphaproteobacteria bacterium]